MTNTRLYVIGDRKNGAIFITTDPLRAASISAEDIGNYAKDNNSNFDETFASMASAIKDLIIRQDGTTNETRDPEVMSTTVGAMIQGGTNVSDADFCFVADLVDIDWEESRIPHPPLVNFLHHLAMGPDANPPQTAKANLKPFGPPDEPAQ